MKTGKLKPSEIQQVQTWAATAPMAQFIREYRNWGFNIGDILIRKRRNYGGDYEIIYVSETCLVPKKFQVMAIDELGVPWVKQLSVRGGLGNVLYCLADMDPVNSKFSVDPRQIDSIILGYKYDPRAEYKAMRDQNPKYGGKHNETR